MGAVLKFIAWVVANIGRWGKAVASQVGRITAWARNNWRRVLEWINAGISFGTILEWILRILGIG
ncbi:aureocin A53 family class IId bacteriocin [Microbacterium sp.]|uniref:aureocin A53 family class IId bacteriocin n=1 Tax=Microbacterium sp. TaxID=51671 RepID=UPI00391A7338